MDARIAPLVEIVRHRTIVVLSGAGCSTESGIPDYRSPESPRRSPMQAREFLASSGAQQRYWARSVAGWSRFAGAQPNAAHRALAQLERSGAIAGIITQNVDRLHHAAGSENVVELHGALAEVTCLSCGSIEDRAALQERFLSLNPGWISSATLAPDGDVDLGPEVVERFRLATCLACEGPLKPKVVFFGENVPPPVTAAAWSLFDRAEVLLIVGSSLTVFSGFRFALRAAERSIPIAIINRGPTRADHLAAARIEARAGEILPLLSERLSPGFGF